MPVKRPTGAAVGEVEELLDNDIQEVSTEVPVVEVPAVEPPVVETVADVVIEAAPSVADLLVKAAKTAPAKPIAVLDVVSDSKADTSKRVKVTFIKDHQYSVGLDKFDMKKGDKAIVELYMANLFASRNIAYITG